MSIKIFPRRMIGVLFFFSLIATHFGCANDRGQKQDAPAQQSIAAVAVKADPVVARIRDEGMNRSKVMDTLDYLCNVIGARLTGSPRAKLANEWTRDTLSSWGLSNAHLEAWGPFGRGWEVKRFSMQIVEPYTIVLSGYPRAWSPGFDAPFTAPVIYLNAEKEADLEQYKGKLSGAIVLMGQPRDVEARFEPLASRLSDDELEKLASAESNSSSLLGQPQPRTQTAAERRAMLAESSVAGEALARNRRGNNRNATLRPTTAPTTSPASRPSRRRGFNPFASRMLAFAMDEGGKLVIGPSSQGDGGTFFVQGASVPGDPGPTIGPTTEPTTNSSVTSSDARSGDAPSTGAASRPTTRPRVWAKDAPKNIPQVTLAVEDYNRLVRILKRDQSLQMAVDMQVKFYDDDEMAYNTIAEIPGTDPQLKDEIVMVGGHLDSWHSGTGATDNGVGAAAAMEAVRIIKALDLKPRRTIRVALWTGEEQGLFGSEAYVKQHFGHNPERREAAQRFRRPAETTDNNEPDGGAGNPATQPASRPIVRVIKAADYEKLSVYFNLDNGTGKIRGIYAQNNPAAVPLFRQWVSPFNDLGASTVSISNTGSTDHVSFDQIGLPGFQFIQDQIEYSSRTHHSNEDVYDRIQAADMKQASTIMATFIWQAANMDERFPRKPMEAPEGRNASR